MKFEPTAESISKHEVPQWYNDAKFGIFIHWSLFSVPAWAPVEGKIWQSCQNPMMDLEILCEIHHMRSGI